MNGVCARIGPVGFTALTGVPVFEIVFCSPAIYLLGDSSFSPGARDLLSELTSASFFVPKNFSILCCPGKMLDFL